MEMRTTVTAPLFPFKLGMRSKILSIGSCFADMIGEKMQRYNLNILSNPFGNIYNPVSIFKIADCKTDLLANLVENDQVWYSYDLHSKLRSLSKDQLSVDIIEQQQKICRLVKNADCIVITFGTAWVYKLKSSGELIANCHKMPASLFEKELLTTSQITAGFNKWFNTISKFNPEVRIILTLSPVRHIKDTIELNSVSKSILRLACFELTEQHENVHYFPSYEIMIDDLRGYRFYKKDLIHPNEIAEDYIWNIWKSGLFDLELLHFMKDWDEILNAMSHIPFNPAGTQHQNFVRAMIQKLNDLGTVTDTFTELQFFKDQLITN